MTGERTYLVLVESERVDGKIKQRVLHRLGRLALMQASGQLDAVISSLGRFSTKLAVLGVIITALARPKFCCSQAMSESRRKLDSVTSEAAMRACGLACA
jgi:hypothetical protein